MLRTMIDAEEKAEPMAAVRGIAQSLCPVQMQKRPATERCKPLIDQGIWWEVQVSNLRPLQCECSALPLS
jgi:hypothetical protein